MTKNPHFNIFSKLALIVISFALVFFILEIGVRIFSPQSVHLFKFNPILGWEHIPNRAGYWRNETRVPVWVKINSKKLRDREFSYEKKDGVFRILVLGDSFTEAVQVRLKDTACKVLETLINPQDKKKIIEVINAGVAGYGTSQEFLYLKHEGFKYNPDLVLVNFFANDVADARSQPFAGKRPLFSIKNGGLALYHKPVPPSGIKKIFKEKILLHSNLALWLKKRIQATHLKQTDKNNNDYIVITGLKHFYDLQEIMDITKMFLLEMSNFAQKIGAKFVVCILPSPYQMIDHYPENIKTQLKTSLSKDSKTDDIILEEISSYLKKNNISYINPLREFTSQAVEGNVLYVDFLYHLTIAGNRLAAESIATHLIENNLIPDVR